MTQAAQRSVGEQRGAATRGAEVLIFANPYSGSGPNRRHVDRFVKALADRKLRPQVVWEREQRRELLTAPDLIQRCRCVVAAGGDGSIAGVVNELSAADLLDSMPFATLPVGTENLFARELGFTRRPARLGHLVDAIAAGRTRCIDLGQAGGRLFTLMASAGFDADIVHRMDRWRTGPADGSLRRVNRLSYAPRIVRCIREYGWPRISLHVDGDVHIGSHLFIFNLPQYGGNLGIGRHACCDDAKLDWVLFERPGLAPLAGYAWHVMRLRHLGRSDVRHGCATNLRITADCPIPLQTDGDPAGFTPVDVTIRPGALRVIDVGRA